MGRDVLPGAGKPRHWGHTAWDRDKAAPQGALQSIPKTTAAPQTPPNPSDPPPAFTSVSERPRCSIPFGPLAKKPFSTIFRQTARQPPGSTPKTSPHHRGSGWAAASVSSPLPDQPLLTSR
uniref:Uncharacterized protein n=1 Tax=Buteo japonicus TaxID=224669 RepID=A0A8C0BJR0_9AVES